jgi:hypothetical protein
MFRKVEIFSYNDFLLKVVILGVSLLDKKRIYKDFLRIFTLYSFGVAFMCFLNKRV